MARQRIASELQMRRLKRPLRTRSPSKRISLACRTCVRSCSVSHVTCAVSRDSKCLDVPHTRIAVKCGVDACVCGEQYTDRKILKRDMRALWIQRINAGTREHGLKYGDFIHGQKLANVALDRKILADLAVTEPHSFKTVVEMAKDALLKKHGAAASPA